MIWSGYLVEKGIRAARTAARPVRRITRLNVSGTLCFRMSKNLYYNIQFVSNKFLPEFF